MISFKKYLGHAGRALLVGGLIYSAPILWNYASEIGEQNRIERQRKIDSQRIDLTGRIIQKKFIDETLFNLGRLTLTLDQGYKVVFNQGDIFDSDRGREGYTISEQKLQELKNLLPYKGDVKIKALYEGKHNEYTGLDAQILE